MQRLLAPLVFAIAWAVLPTVAESAPELRWSIESSAYVHYRVLDEDVTDSQGVSTWGEVTDLHGFYGYEIEDGRTVQRDVTREEWLRTLFVFRLPRAPARVGRAEEIDEVLPATYRLASIRARGRLAVTAIRPQGEGSLIDLSGMVVFEPADLSQDAVMASFRYMESAILRWSSTFDTVRGVVTRVVFDLSFTSKITDALRPTAVSDYSRETRAYRAHFELELDRVFERRYQGFQRDVDTAIDTGCHYLESCIADPRMYERKDARGMGEVGLALLALIKGGRDAEDPNLQPAFEWLLKQEPRKTYDVGCAMMAVEARRTPAIEMVRLRRGELVKPLPRTLKPNEFEFMQKCADFLVEYGKRKKTNRRPVTGDNGVDLYRWGYPRDFGDEAGARDYWDNSNTQYAVLGLNSATRCSVRIPPALWLGVAEHYIQAQEEYGLERKGLRLRPHGKRDEGGRRYATPAVTAFERGWAYHEIIRPPPTVQTGKGQPRLLHRGGWGTIAYGSMTVAGISSLSIANAHLDSRRRTMYRQPMRKRVEEAIRDGWAALEGMWTVFENPNYDGWYLYHLYGLERAGILSDVEWVGIHDWYWEGAIQLLLRLPAHKRWTEDRGHLYSTAWGILFLARGTAPVTPR